MKIPRVLREQEKFYASKGFHMIDAENRAGAHFLVRFAEFPEPQILSKNGTDPRGWLNNIARFRRLKEQVQR